MPDISQLLLYVFFFISLYVEVFLFVAFFETRAKEKARAALRMSEANLPSVTIIVPCYNEELTIAKTVQSLVDLEYPKKLLRIMIVDDGSTDDTYEIAQQFSFHRNIRIFRKENGGKHTALNFGIARTDTDLVGCLDADSFVNRDALMHIVRAFTNPEVAAATPAIKIFRPQGVIRHLQKAEYEVSIFLRRVFGGLNSLYVTPGPFSLFRREIFSILGPFKKAHNTEDMEYAMRIQASRYKIANVHSARVYTVGPKTLVGLYRQRRRWVTGFLKNVWDYRFLMFSKHHGALGAVILPAAIISIFSALYLAIYGAVAIASKIIDKLALLQVVNYNVHFSWGDVSWFYINTHAFAFLALIMLTLWATAILIGKRLAGEPLFASFDIVYYLLLYGFIAPFWLAASVYNALLGIQRPWK
jgi:cellulose synthase/poly-beta-1,6-N-acetylglucosamine synthase-like glycosyltransferase